MNVNISQLDSKSLIAILNYYNKLDNTFKRQYSFSDFVNHNVIKNKFMDSVACSYAISCVSRYSIDQPLYYFAFYDSDRNEVIQNPAEYTDGCVFLENPFSDLTESEEKVVRDTLANFEG